MSLAIERALDRAAAHIKREGCPLPLDIAAELSGLGLEVEVIEQQLTNEEG